MYLQTKLLTLDRGKNSEILQYVYKQTSGFHPKLIIFALILHHIKPIPKPFILYKPDHDKLARVEVLTLL